MKPYDQLLMAIDFVKAHAQDIGLDDKIYCTGVSCKECIFQTLEDPIEGSRCSITTNNRDLVNPEDILKRYIELEKGKGNDSI